MRREHLLWGASLVCLALLAYAFYLVFSPFFRAIAWAVILAILLAPVQRLLGRWIDSRGWRALLTVILAAILLLGPILAIGTALVGELITGLQYLQAHAGEIQETIESWNPATLGPVAGLRDWVEAGARRWLGERPAERLFQEPDLQGTISAAAQRLSQFLLDQTSAVFRNVAGLTFTILVTWLTLFYLLRDGDKVLEAALELLPYPDAHRDDMLERLNEVVLSSVYGGLAVAFTQGLLGGIAFAIIGLPSPVLWGTVMAFLSFLPLLGAFIVWIPACITLAIQGFWGSTIFLAVWGAVVVGFVDNFLRPILISGRTQMHPLLVFLAVLGGIQAFGFLGLFLGPVLVATLTGVLDLYRAAVRGEFGAPEPDEAPEPAA